MSIHQKILDQLDPAGGPAGRWCLDFANTLRKRLTAHPVELLVSYAELVAWSRQAGVLTAQEARALLREANGRPEEAATVLRRAFRLREAIYAIFRAVVTRRPPEAADLATLNAALAKGMGRLRVVPKSKGFAWDAPTDRRTLDRLLWPVARSAADLLTTDNLAAVRQCAGHKCARLFLDKSHNRSRRWCDMKVCGNRAKARRHYERQRVGRRAGGRTVRT